MRLLIVWICFLSDAIKASEGVIGLTGFIWGNVAVFFGLGEPGPTTFCGTLYW